MSDTRAFFDISVNNEPAGRVIFELYTDELPITTKNFITLLSTLKYKDSIIHRIVKGFMIQGGDYTKGDGTGGMSIYGERFADEAFTHKHTKRGILSMANAGPDTNGSQFFITLDPTPHLDGKHVVFGAVVSGMSVIDTLEAVETDDSEKPLLDCVISNCGVMVRKSRIKEAKPKSKKSKKSKRHVSSDEESDKEGKKRKVEEEEEEIAGHMPPEDTQFNWLDRGGSRKNDGKRLEETSFASRVDGSGLEIKGRGEVRYC